jgi:hypothetical protein
VTLARYGGWGPRLGFAYSIDNKTVIRSGAAILYPGTTADNSGNYPTVQGFNPITNPVDTANGFTPFNNPARAGLLSNPFPNGLNPVVGSTLGPLTSVGNSNTGFLRNDKQPTVQQWNFGVQRELPENLLIEAAYVGSHGVHLEDFSGAQFNVLPDQYLSLGNALFDSLPNPFYGVLPASSTVGASNTITREQLLLPYPYFTGVTGQAGHIATSNYNALQAKVQKRLSKGVSFLFSYTFAKSLDNASSTDSSSGVGHQDLNNRRLDDSVSAFDRTHVANLSYIYELPFGRGRLIGASLGVPALTQLISGWKISGITTWASGLPLPMTCGICTFPANRADLIGDPAADVTGSTVHRLSDYFNTSAFAVNQSFAYGTAPRYLSSIRGPGQANTNLSIIKDTMFRERYRLEFRAEFFNLFNRVEFGLPDTTYGDTTFGQISTQVNIPRQIQFGLKLYF